MEARGEKINVSSGPSKEIAGLKKKMMMKMMTLGSQNSRVWEFSHEALKVRRQGRIQDFEMGGSSKSFGDHAHFFLNPAHFN